MHDRREVLRRGLFLAAGAAGMGLAGCAGKVARGEQGLFSVDYTPRDYEVVDYAYYEIPGIPRMKFRGPAINPATTRNFFTCIGAAQTLGVYIEKPFPTLVSEKLGIPVWNAGVGGATPYFFLQQPQLIDLVNRGKFAVLQIMTARSEPNSRFTPNKPVEMVKDRRSGESLRTPLMWERIQQESPDKMAALIAQSRASWNEDMIALLKRIKVPVLLFWFAPPPRVAVARRWRPPLPAMQAFVDRMCDV